MRTVSRFLLGATLAMVVTPTTFAVPSRADDVMHPVTYVITSASPIYADIYYLDQQPPKFSDYSHNPYQFTPHVERRHRARATPGSRPMVMLSDPNDYAMVTVSTGTEPGTPMFHCALVVDGTVVVSNDGAKGTLCSLRQLVSRLDFGIALQSVEVALDELDGLAHGRRTCRAPARSPGPGKHWSSAPTTPAGGTSAGVDAVAVAEPSTAPLRCSSRKRSA